MWITKVQTLLVEWPQHETCLMLHDLRKIEACTAIKRLQKQVATVDRHDLNLNHALIIDSDATTPCLNSLPSGEYHSFMSRGTALMWLLSHLDH